METSFNDLEIACLVRVFSFLGPKDCARACCVHSLWNSIAGDDAVWKAHLEKDFASSSAVNADGSMAATYRTAYCSFTTAYADVAGPMLARALACWSGIKTWLAANSQQILATLNPGATAAELAAAEQELGHELPLAVRCIYRVHNGQDLHMHHRDPANLLLGLFGTLIFYDHVTSNALLPLEEMVRVTKILRSIRPMGARHPLVPNTHVVFAHSFNPNDKVCVLDARTGGVYLKLPPSQNRDWPLAPATDSYPGACDGMLRWMEEYGRRLAAGWYAGCESDSTAKGLEDSGVRIAGAISLFPRAYPAAATAITRGVKVTWSAVLVPQESRQGRLMFTYSVKFALLTPEQEAAALERLAQEQQQWQQQQHGHSVCTTTGSAQSFAAATVAAAEAAPAPAAPDQAFAPQPSVHAPPDDAEPSPPTLAAAAAAQASAAGAPGSAVGDAAGVDFAGNPSAAIAAAAAAAAGAPAPAPAATSSRSTPSGSGIYKQGLVIGPCDASAGGSCVPNSLAAPAAWPVPGAGSGGGSSNGGGLYASSAMPPAGPMDALPAAAATAAAAGTAGGSSSGTAGSAVSPSSCQLESRDWRILDAEGGLADTVQGEGVVGLYPLLVPGGEEFSYASCTPLSVTGGREHAGLVAVRPDPAAAAAEPQQLAGSVLGAMEGSFTFVEGSIMQRMGPEFIVRCPRLVFAVPEYLY